METKERICEAKTIFSRKEHEICKNFMETNLNEKNSSKKPEDDFAVLVELLQQGDKEAFSEIVRQYTSKGFRTALLIVGNENGAEDVLQDTFVKIYLKRADLKTPQAFSSWFYKILIRTAWEFAKKNQREVPKEEFSQQKDVFEQDMEITLIEKELGAKIRSAINQLSFEQRIVVIMYYYRQFSVREIADATGMFQGTVKSRLFLARKKLNKLLKEEFNQWRGVRHEDERK